MKDKRSVTSVKYDWFHLGHERFCVLCRSLAKIERVKMDMKFGGKNRGTLPTVLFTTLLLAACGGGGGGSDGTIGGGTASANTAPATGTTTPATDTTTTPVTDTTTTPAATQLDISSFSPAVGDAVALNTVIRVAFNVKVDPATIVSLEPTAFTVWDSRNENFVEGSVQLDADGMTAIFTPRNNLLADTEYVVTVSTAIKSIDGTSLAADRTWNLRSAPAAVQSTYPAAGASELAINSKIAAVFNSSIAPSTITSFTVTPAGGAPVPGTVTYDSNAATTTETRTAIFTPTSNLLPGTVYTATVTTAATGTTNWTFTTSTNQDTVKPTVTFSPADNAENVGINSGIRLTFSEPINLSKVSLSTIFVSNASHMHLSGSIVIDNANNAVTFFPSSAMDPDTPYHIVVNDGIEDLAGNKLDTGSNTEVQSHFRTGPR
jgi:hypothetical protein